MADKSSCNCFSGCTALSPDSFHAQESGERLKALQPFFFQLILGTQRTFKDSRPAWENNRVRKYSTSSKATEPKKVKSWGLCLYGDISWLFTGSSKQSSMNTVEPVNTISTGFNSELRKKILRVRVHSLSGVTYCHIPTTICFPEIYQLSLVGSTVFKRSFCPGLGSDFHKTSTVNIFRG